MLWVVSTNLTAIYVQFLGVRQVVVLNTLLDQQGRNKALWIHFSLWAAIPLLGIVLEVLRSRFAKWLNLSYFAYLAIVFSTGGVLTLPDHHAFVSLFFGAIAVSFFAVSYLLYRKPKATPIATANNSR